MHRTFYFFYLYILKSTVELIFYNGFFIRRYLQAKKKLASNHMKIKTKDIASKRWMKSFEHLGYFYWSTRKIRWYTYDKGNIRTMVVSMAVRHGPIIIQKTEYSPRLRFIVAGRVQKNGLIVYKKSSILTYIFL